MSISSPDGAHFNPQECLRIPQVAEELKVAPSTIYRLLTKHEIRGCRVAGRLRIRRLELKRYLDRTTEALNGD